MVGRLFFNFLPETEMGFWSFWCLSFQREFDCEFCALVFFRFRKLCFLFGAFPSRLNNAKPTPWYVRGAPAENH